MLKIGEIWLGKTKGAITFARKYSWQDNLPILNFLRGK